MVAAFFGQGPSAALYIAVNTESLDAWVCAMAKVIY